MQSARGVEQVGRDSVEAALPAHARHGVRWLAPIVARSICFAWRPATASSKSRRAAAAPRWRALISTFSARGVTTQLNDGPGVTFDQVGGAFSITHSGRSLDALQGRRVRALRAGHAPIRIPRSTSTGAMNEAGLLELQARMRAI